VCHEVEVAWLDPALSPILTPHQEQLAQMDVTGEINIYIYMFEHGWNGMNHGKNHT
jgi:hypothetical protein